jgi:hypothetical protein
MYDLTSLKYVNSSASENDIQGKTDITFCSSSDYFV